MKRFCQIIQILFIIIFSTSLNAQNKLERANCDKIKISDSLTVNPGDFVLDGKEKIDINKTLIDKNNIKSINLIENPCSNIHSGYKGAYIIERKLNFPIFNLSGLVEKYKIEYPDFSFYKVVVNQKLLTNYSNYKIEITKGFKLNIIKDEIRERTLTILIEQ